LAAGFGTRLQPLTLLRAKPAVPFLNRPLITHAVDWLREAGIDEIIVNLHHLPETVRESLADSPGDIRFSMEEEILGRGGALKRVQDFLAADTFVICNGKIYLEQALAPVLDFHRDNKSMVTMLVVPWTPASPFNPVLMHPDGRIAEFALGRGPDEWPPGLRPAVFTGVHVVEPEVLERLPEGASDTVGDLYPQLIAEGARVLGCPSQAFWCESSTPRRYLDNSLELLGRRVVTGLCASEGVAVHTGCVIGSGCRVSLEASLSAVVLWDEVVVEAEATLERVIVTSQTSVPAGVTIRDRVVTPASDALLEAASDSVERVGQLLLWPLEVA